MRLFVLAAVAMFVFALPAYAENPPSFSRPATEQFLRQLDSDQLRIVRRAVQGCPSISTGSNVIKPERNPCVTSSADKAVADSGNGDLLTFHNALRPSERYDENRTSAAWMVWLVKN